MDNEFDEFYAPTYPKVDNFPIVGTDPTTGRQKVRMEEKHFYAEDDYGFDPSPSAKKRMRKRRFERRRYPTLANTWNLF